NCTSLESLDMSGIDLSSLTSMERIFSSNSGYSMVYGCMSNIGEMSVDLSNAKLGSVTTMSYMFAGNTKLSNVTFKGADIGSGHNNGVTMSYMFNGCTSLTNADLSLISMDYATSTSNMFNGCTGLKKADMSSAVFPYVTDMSCMFYGCTSLESLDMSGADLSAVTNISSMCYGCTALTEANLSGAKLSAMTSRANMLWAFGDCENLESLDMSGIDLSSLTSMERIFSSNSGYSMVYGCITLIGRMSIDLSGAKLSKVETMDNMFDGNTSLASVTFKGADIGGSSKNGVTMSYMFSSCTNLASVDMRYASSTGRDIEESTEDAQEESIAGADLSAADLSQVTDMEYMFYNCTSLESIGLTGTVLGSVTNVNYMLNGCEKITTLDFSATDMTALTSQNAAYMLKGITELKIIYAPVGLAAAVNVPDNGTWYIAGDTSGEPITVIPQNQSESVRIYNGELADDEDLGDALEEGETEEETEEEESEESERAKLTVDDTTEDSTESGSEESEDGTESGSTESGDDTESGSTESGDGSTESGSAAKSSISLKSSEITVTAANLVETGKPQYAVTVTYIYKNGSKSYRQQLTEGVHYTVKIASGGTTAGEALVEITGTGTETDLGTFKDTETATYTILQKADAKSDVAHNIAKMKFSLNSTDLKNNTYTGLYITPAVENAAGLVENTDYTVSYKNNVNAGKATVTVMGIAPYYGTKTLTFTIKKADITKQSVSFTASNVKQFSGSGKTLTATAASSFAYSKGKAVTLKNLAMTLGDVPMSALEDYTVSYKNNTKPGTATATVKGMNNLSGSIKITYPITAASDSEFRNVLTGSSATKPLSAEYSSKGARLTSITVGSTKLLEGTDYTVKYPGDTDASVTTVTVTGKGVYKNVKKVTAYIKTVKGSYHIKSGAVVDSSKISTSETAKIIKAAKITDAEGKLIDADTVTLTVGTSSITVTPNTGNTNYQKTVLSCRYAMKLSSLKQGSTPTKYFDGVNSVTLTKTEIAGALGVSENDFTVISYKNNHKTGTAQVTVTAKSSSGYYGTKTVKFKIAKQP
ncbi:MAG: DUF285 domain-containing protein, partial [Lachnospiraceae bacterium]|nr:DUF285 domain-containing protein [Lachnospiraceae bacterium]